MSDEQLGQVVSGSNNEFQAKWYPSNGEVYVKAPGGGWTSVPGKAHNSHEALNMTDAFVRNK
jgi:hypothetical protein